MIEAVQLLEKTQSLLVVSGSGISQPSGVPTYRGDEGLYQDSRRMLYLQDLNDDPHKVWTAVKKMRDIIRDKVPNRAHYILAEWENYFSRFLIVTQNIDGVHC